MLERVVNIVEFDEKCNSTKSPLTVGTFSTTICKDKKIFFLFFNLKNQESKNNSLFINLNHNVYFDF